MPDAVHGKSSSRPASGVSDALRRDGRERGCRRGARRDAASCEDIGRQDGQRCHRHVMTSFASSLAEFDSLYRELAR